MKKQDQHYNPQFYLREWAATSGPNKGKLLQYKLIEHTGAPHPKWVAPRSTSYKTNLYTAPSGVDFETRDPQIIETEFFQKLDDDAAKVLPKLLAAAGEPLTADERHAWTRFLNAVVHRHKDLLEDKDRWAKEHAVPYRDKWINNAKSDRDRRAIIQAFKHMDVEVHTKSSLRGHMCQMIDRQETLSAISSLAWNVGKVDDGTILTTDRPLLVPCREAGQTVITIPLSPTRVFIAHPPVDETASDETKAEMADALQLMCAEYNNMLLAHPATYVYASKPVEGDLLKRVKHCLTMGLKKSNAARTP